MHQFGKWFDSAYTGSMMGAGADVFAVMTYAVAHAWDSFVELNPPVIAALIGMPVENVERAIEFLCQPDPNSRNPVEGGRRLIRQSGFGYRVVSHSIYRGMRDAKERTDYMREKQQEFRARKKKKASTVSTQCQPSLTIVNQNEPISESESESESDIVLLSQDSYPETAEAVPDGDLTPRQKGAKKAQKTKSKKRKAKPPTKTDLLDARHRDFKAAIWQYWQSRNAVDCPWGPPEGLQLDLWLKQSPHVTLPEFKTMLRNRYRSDVNHADRPSMWIKNITSFANSPLDRFGFPVTGEPVNGKRTDTRPNPESKQSSLANNVQAARASLRGLDHGGTGTDRSVAGRGGHDGEDHPHSGDIGADQPRPPARGSG